MSEIVNPKIRIDIRKVKPSRTPEILRDADATNPDRAWNLDKIVSSIKKNEAVGL